MTRRPLRLSFIAIVPGLVRTANKSMRVCIPCLNKYSVYRPSKILRFKAQKFQFQIFRIWFFGGFFGSFFIFFLQKLEGSTLSCAVVNLPQLRANAYTPIQTTTVSSFATRKIAITRQTLGITINLGFTITRMAVPTMSPPGFWRWLFH